MSLPLSDNSMMWGALARPLDLPCTLLSIHWPRPSDVKAVAVALQAAADKTSSRSMAEPRAAVQRVVPLFETLDDLNGAGATLKRLLDTPWYRRQLRCAQLGSRGMHVTDRAPGSEPDCQQLCRRSTV